jgi:hypothetical protein
MSRIRKLLVAAASVAVVASVAAPASAAEQTFTDDRGFRGGFDIHSVRVVNTGDWVKIRTHHDNLRYGTTQNGGVSVYINTIRHMNGPEFRFSGPVGFDGGYSLLKVRDWKPISGVSRNDCDADDYRFGVNYQRDVVSFAVTRGCLARAFDMPIRKLRVAVAASQNRAEGGMPRVDWAPKPRALYPAVPHN